MEVSKRKTPNKIINMKAKIVKLNKEKAKEILSRNINNRRIKESSKSGYSFQMSNGLWKENGEPIIIDKNGVVKDGQHRLLAVINSDYEYKVPLIYDVEPDVMDTIDTGVNRTAGDVLHLNGFKCSNQIAAISKSIILYKNQHSQDKGGWRRVHNLTNSVILKFAKENKELLSTIFKIANNTNSTGVKAFSSTELSFYLYVVSLGYPNEIHKLFIKHLVGAIVSENDAPSYVRNLVLKSKAQKVRLNRNYILAMVIKSFNLFANGNPAIRYIKYDLKSAMPKPIQL